MAKDGELKKRVILDSVDRARIYEISRLEGGCKTKKLHARILLELDESGGRMPAPITAVAAKTGTSFSTVSRTRKKYNQGGIEAVFVGKVFETPGGGKVSFEEVKSLVLKIFQSLPPNGKRNWSCQDIADKLVSDKVCLISSRQVRKMLGEKCPRWGGSGKWRIVLDSKANEVISKVLRLEQESGYKKAYARVLLALDEANGRIPMPTKEITKATGVSPEVISRIRRKYNQGGIAAVIKIKDKKPKTAMVSLAEIEACVAKIVQSPPPKGKERWSRRDIADKLVRDKIVGAISKQRVGRILRKNFPDKTDTTKWRVVLDKDAKQKINKVLMSEEAPCKTKKNARILLDLDSSGGKKPASYTAIIRNRGAYKLAILRLKVCYIKNGIDMALHGKKRSKKPAINPR